MPGLRHPTALVSWAHVDPGWSPEQSAQRQEAVLLLANTLRHLGVDVDVDLYHLSEPVDWTRWGPEKAADCDFVLVVASRSWKAAWEGRGDPTKGAGAAAEADVLRSAYAKDRSAFRAKVRLVLLPGTDEAVIPDGLHGVQRYDLKGIDEEALNSLLRDLTGQPEFLKPELGQLPDLPARPLAYPPGPVTPEREPLADDSAPSSPESPGAPGRRNALAKAQEYLRHTAFSQSGLASQLAFEGFSVEEAEYATTHIDVDWVQQAARKARDYIASMAFSSEGLAKQLSADGFTADDASEAVGGLDVDWVQQAVKKGNEYLSFSAFSAAGLVRQLSFDGFSASDAEAAVAEIYR